MWLYVDKQLKPVNVRLGITDGTNTELLSNELQENTAALPFNLESAVSQQQLLDQVKRALEKLPVQQRAAVELAYFEGLTHTEIAERTGDPLGTVKTRLRSALESLKRDLHP